MGKQIRKKKSSKFFSFPLGLALLCFGAFGRLHAMRLPGCTNITIVTLV
jgi:hypothetical protein